MWLKRAQFRHIVLGHLRDAREFLQPIHAARLQREHRLVLAQVARQIRVAPEHPAAHAVDQEQRRLAAPGLDLHHSRTGFRWIAVAQHSGQLRDGRTLEDRRHRQPLAKRLFHPRQQPHRQQRVSAQLKKLVLHADGLEAQNLLPDFLQLELHRIARRDESFLRREPRHFRRAQRMAIHLAVGVERQRVHEHERRRDHIVGQFLLQEGAEIRGRRRGRFRRDDEGREGFFPVRIGVGRHRTFENSGMLVQRGFNFSRFHAEAANLRLQVKAPEKFNAAVRQPAHEIAGLVKTRVGRLIVWSADFSPLPRGKRAGA